MGELEGVIEMQVRTEKIDKVMLEHYRTDKKYNNRIQKV